MYFKYKALDLLSHSFSNNFTHVYICCFYVFTNNDIPFLSYLLQKDNSNNYNFPIIKYDNSLHQNVYNLFLLKLNENIHFKGFKIFNENLFAFYEITDIIVNPSYQSGNIFVKCLIYEILNIKQFFLNPISFFVIDFFLNNPSFCYLYDLQDSLLELPIVAFYNVNSNISRYYLFNDIILHPDYDFYQLYLSLNNTSKKQQHFITLRYAVFIKKFISFRSLTHSLLIQNLNLYDSVIISSNNSIFFQQKSQQTLLS